MPSSVYDDPVLRREWQREGPRFVRAARERKGASGRQRVGAWELAIETRPEMYAAAYPRDEWERILFHDRGPGEYFEAQEREFDAEQQRLAEAEEAYYAERAAEQPADDSWLNDPFAEFFAESA